MFISKKRWNEMERRVSALEKKCFPEVGPLNQMKAALEAALRSYVHQPESVTLYLDGKELSSLLARKEP